jgi:hypothetical protein
MAAPTFTPSEKRVVLAMFAQHWENARHIKNERLSFTNIYLQFMPAVDLRGDPLRHPKFRWLFPWFYGIAFVGFAGILVVRTLSR